MLDYGIFRKIDARVSGFVGDAGASQDVPRSSTDDPGSCGSRLGAIICGVGR